MSQISLLTPHIIFVVIGILYLIKISISIVFFISSHFVTNIPVEANSAVVIEKIIQKEKCSSKIKHNYSFNNYFSKENLFFLSKSVNYSQKLSLLQIFIFIINYSSETLPNNFILSNHLLRPPPGR